MPSVSEKLSVFQSLNASLLASLIIIGFFPLCVSATEFTVMTYNVENLFDVDGSARFTEYLPEGDDPALTYTPDKLLVKLQNLRSAITSVNGGSGPEVLIIQELERDRTPKWKGSAEAFLKKHQSLRLEKMLDSSQVEKYLEVPSHFWLLKALADEGLSYPYIAMGAKAGPQGKAQVNATFSRYPIKEVKRHSLKRARPILETRLDIEGTPFVIFNNHWKSGGKHEDIRVQNASVLKQRIEELEKSGLKDYLLAGDFNSYYNQKQVYPKLKKTGINDVLKTSGNERSVIKGKAPLYNLWMELPREERGSDTYKGRWGTLMSMIIPTGCYDGKGVDYVDGSFHRVFVDGVTYDSQKDAPLRWVALGIGSSDHLPIIARFMVTPPGMKPASVGLGGNEEFTDYLKKRSESLPSSSESQSAPLFHEVLKDKKYTKSSYDRVYRVKAKVIKVQDITYTVELKDGRQLEVFERVRGAYKKRMPKLKEAKKSGTDIEFIGVLTIHRGKWQFGVVYPQWFLKP